MEKKKNKKLIAALIAVMIAALLLAGGLTIYFISVNKDDSNSYVAGTVVDGWDTNLESQADATTSGIQVPGYSRAVMNSGDTTLKLRIGNPSANTCGFYATLMLEDGTKLYESTLLKPGQGLEEIPLSQTLEKGDYKAYVLYQAVTLDEEPKNLNSAESGFTLTVN